MMTTTHILMAATATTRPKMAGWMITVGWLGGFVPDFPMFAMVAASRMDMTASDNLWRRPDGLYWTDPWQALIDWGHSMPLWLAVGLAGFLVWRSTRGRWRTIGLACLMFAAGAAIHSMVDFGVHTDDAHAQFLPFSDWRFYSPVSYYQRDHHGQIISIIEVAMGVGMAGWLVYKFKSWPIRIISVLMAAPYLLRLLFLIYGPPGGM